MYKIKKAKHGNTRNPEVINDITFETEKQAETWIESQGYKKDPLFDWFTNKEGVMLTFNTRTHY